MQNGLYESYKTLLNAAGETAESAAAESGDASGHYDEAVVSKELQALMVTSTGASDADVAKFVEDPTVAPIFNHICALSVNALLQKNFDKDQWTKSCATPYMKVFYADADALTATLVSKAEELYLSTKKVFVVEDEEGEDLCKCDFSLGVRCAHFAQQRHFAHEEG